ncbi:conserved hypothetical protein [Ricinus communis]|uniref:Uncharacterized protein n=1 Tax=Ricinus communis TaxID=3988 RepID=B9SCU9_RICCO|nr:conserved hypothetical protein [Ricinus communis]
MKETVCEINFLQVGEGGDPRGKDQWTYATSDKFGLRGMYSRWLFIDCFYAV